MKHAKRKGGAFCAVLTALLCAMVFIGCAGARIEDGGTMIVLSDCGNFSLEIEVIGVNRKTARIGDTITVTATLSNLSGEAVEIEFIERDVLTSATGDNMIHLEVTNAGTAIVHTIVPSVKANIAKNGTLMRTVVVESLNHVGEYLVWAEVIFFADSNNEPITLRVFTTIQVK